MIAVIEGGPLIGPDPCKQSLARCGIIPASLLLSVRVGNCQRGHPLGGQNKILKEYFPAFLTMLEVVLQFPPLRRRKCARACQGTELLEFFVPLPAVAIAYHCL